MCWDCYDNKKGDPYKIFTQGGVDVADFDDEIPYRHPPRKQKKAKERKRGCPENNNKGHVYIWELCCHRYYLPYSNTWKEYQYKRKICCGCGHVNKNVYSWNRQFDHIEVY